MAAQEKEAEEKGDLGKNHKNQSKVIPKTKEWAVYCLTNCTVLSINPGMLTNLLGDRARIVLERQNGIDFFRRALGTVPRERSIEQVQTLLEHYNSRERLLMPEQELFPRIQRDARVYKYGLSEGNPFVMQLSLADRISFFREMLIDVVLPHRFVVQQGEKANSFFVLLSGSASIFARLDNSDLVHLGNMEVGDCYGELALMTNNPHCASVTTNTTCEFACLPYDVFVGLLQAWNPPRHEVFSFLANLDLLNANIPASLLLQMTQGASIQTYRKGDQVHGTVDGVFFVLDGKLNVLQKVAQEKDTLEAYAGEWASKWSKIKALQIGILAVGEVLGERSFLLHDKSKSDKLELEPPVSFVADVPTKLIFIPAHCFYRCYRLFPKPEAKKILDVYNHKARRRQERVQQLLSLFQGVVAVDEAALLSHHSLGVQTTQNSPPCTAPVWPSGRFQWKGRDRVPLNVFVVEERNKQQLNRRRLQWLSAINKVLEQLKEQKEQRNAREKKQEEESSESDESEDSDFDGIDGDIQILEQLAKMQRAPQNINISNLRRLKPNKDASSEGPESDKVHSGGAGGSRRNKGIRVRGQGTLPWSRVDFQKLGNQARLTAVGMHQTTELISRSSLNRFQSPRKSPWNGSPHSSRISTKVITSGGRNHTYQADHRGSSSQMSAKAQRVSLTPAPPEKPNANSVVQLVPPSVSSRASALSERAAIPYDALSSENGALIFSHGAQSLPGGSEFSSNVNGFISLPRFQQPDNAGHEIPRADATHSNKQKSTICNISTIQTPTTDAILKKLSEERPKFTVDAAQRRLNRQQVTFKSVLDVDIGYVPLIARQKRRDKIEHDNAKDVKRTMQETSKAERNFISQWCGYNARPTKPLSPTSGDGGNKTTENTARTTIFRGENTKGIQRARKIHQMDPDDFNPRTGVGGDNIYRFGVRRAPETSESNGGDSVPLTVLSTRNSVYDTNMAHKDSFHAHLKSADSISGMKVTDVGAGVIFLEIPKDSLSYTGRTSQYYQLSDTSSSQSLPKQDTRTSSLADSEGQKFGFTVEGETRGGTSKTTEDQELNDDLEQPFSGRLPHTARSVTGVFHLHDNPNLAQLMGGRLKKQQEEENQVRLVDKLQRYLDDEETGDSSGDEDSALKIVPPYSFTVSHVLGFQARSSLGLFDKPPGLGEETAHVILVSPIDCYTTEEHVRDWFTHEIIVYAVRMARQDFTGAFDVYIQFSWRGKKNVTSSSMYRMIAKRLIKYEKPPFELKKKVFPFRLPSSTVEVSHRIANSREHQNRRNKLSCRPTLVAAGEASLDN